MIFGTNQEPVFLKSLILERENTSLLTLVHQFQRIRFTKTRTESILIPTKKGGVM